MSDGYHQAFARLLSLENLEKPLKWSSPASLRASLKRIRQVLSRLGDPHTRLKYVHVTGTSGKGTVTNLIHEILLTNGAKVASYTSPHTTTYLERFKVNDKLADPNALAKTIDKVLKVHEEHIRAGGHNLSYFELSFCIAVQLFVDAKVEWCVLEVGMGGRWDATNVIPTPAVAVITNIDLDHTQFLGNSKTLIAGEKAGIIKTGSIAITGETAAEPLKVIRKEAKLKRTPLLIIPDHTHDFNQHNQDLARAVGLSLGIEPKVIDRAFKTVKPLPCRFETIQDRPIVIVDGAHNHAKIKATVSEWKRRGFKKAHVVFGCKSSKNAKKMIQELKAITKTVRITRFTQGYGQPANPAELLKFFPTSTKPQAFLEPMRALEDALKHTPKGEPILITGSLYLAGELRSHWRSEAKILRERQS